MSASTPHATLSSPTRSTYLGTPRQRMVAAGFIGLGIAIASGLGIALTTQTRTQTQTVEPITRSEPLASVAAVQPLITPWRDTWYVDDQFGTAPAPAAAVLPAMGLKADRWYLEPRSALSTSPATRVVKGDRWFLE